MEEQEKKNTPEKETPSVEEETTQPGEHAEKESVEDSPQPSAEATAADEKPAEKETVDFEVTREEDLPNSVKKYTLKVPADSFKQSLGEKLDDLKDNVAIPGFRKGKAPMKLIEIQFGEAARQETVEELFPEIMKKLLKDKDIDAVGQPRLTDFDVADDYTLTLETEIEYLPSLDLEENDYKNVDVEIPKTEITEETIDSYIDNVRWQSAMLEPKDEDAACEKGDAVVADVKVTDENDNTIDSLTRENMLLKRPEKDLPEKVCEELHGKKRDDTITVEVPMERKNQEGDVESTKDTYTVTIRDIKEVDLPELDDEFAKDIGDFETFDELRKKVKENFETNKQQQEQQAIVQQVFNNISEKVDVELPQGAVAGHAHSIANRELQQLSMQGLSLPPDLQKEFVSSMQEQAASDIMGWLIRREIAAKENIDVSEEDINKELERLGEQMGRKPLAIRANLEAKKQFDDFVEDLKMKKVDDLIAENAHITYTEQDNDKGAE